MIRHPKLPVPSPRQFPPKPKRLPTRRRVTIGVGVLCGDGSVVLAADSEEVVQGYWKREHWKIFGIFKDDTTLMVIGSGRSGYCDALASDLNEAVNVNATDPVELVIRRTVAAFNREHVAPYHDLPDLQMLIATQDTDHRGLFVTDRSACTACNQSKAIGIGSAHAYEILNFVPQPATTDQGVALAAYAVFHAKERTDGCGQATSIVCLEGSRCTSVSREAVAQMDNLFRYFERGVNPAILSLMFGYVRESALGNISNQIRTDRKNIAELVRDRAAIVE